MGTCFVCGKSLTQPLSTYRSVQIMGPSGLIYEPVTCGTKVQQVCETTAIRVTAMGQISDKVLTGWVQTSHGAAHNQKIQPMAAKGGRVIWVDEAQDLAPTQRLRGVQELAYGFAALLAQKEQEARDAHRKEATTRAAVEKMMGHIQRGTLDAFIPNLLQSILDRMDDGNLFTARTVLDEWAKEQRDSQW